VARALDAVQPIGSQVFEALASPVSSVPGSVVPRLGAALWSMTVPVVLVGGDDRLVSEYMQSEFLERISQRDRVFLTRTAVLERMSGPLCDAVLELPGSAAILADLARSNLLWCRWTGETIGTATITCSGTCSWRSWNACSPS
jgi:hypothetical protein